jgi:L-serine dehydratase
MHSLRELFQIGAGPSSSHTMGPQRAAQRFLQRFPALASVRVTLYGSLGATGRGHLTDRAIAKVFGDRPTTFVWKPEIVLPAHPNGLDFEGFDTAGAAIGRMRIYSVGGGALLEDGEQRDGGKAVYELTTFKALLDWSKQTGEPLWRYVELNEGSEIWSYLEGVWAAMKAAIERGLHAEGVLPGSLRLPRKARSYHLKALRTRAPFSVVGKISAYALAASEENAAGATVVTAPTCGSSGVVPAVLRYAQEASSCDEVDVLRALATAGLVGNLVKKNASISGAEVGCQGEIGTACAMAAAAAAELLGGTSPQIEYAAEMGLEHHLGLTCDPVAGLVQIPCIERNAFAATRAVACAEYALLSDGVHRVSFDEVTETMAQTGKDLCAAYRETSAGGLAAFLK